MRAKRDADSGAIAPMLILKPRFAIDYPDKSKTAPACTYPATEAY